MRKIFYFIILIILGAYDVADHPSYAPIKSRGKLQTGLQLDSVSYDTAPSNKNLLTLLKRFPPGTDIKIVRSAVLREGYYVENTSVGEDKNTITFTSSACDWPSWLRQVSYDKNGKTLSDPDGYLSYSPVALNICGKNGNYTKLKAEFGNTKAQHYLACLYTQGTTLDNEAGCEIVEASMTEALKWWRRLAEGGDERSQLFLGAIYSNVKTINRYDFGYGTDKDYDVKQDYAESYFWYGLAVASGDNDVIPLRDKAGKHLTADQKAEEDMRIQKTTAK